MSKMWTSATFYMLFLASLVSYNIVLAGSNYRATQFSTASPWPLPASMTTTEDAQVVKAMLFRFNATAHSCDILEAAFVRYFDIIFHGQPSHVKHREIGGNGREKHNSQPLLYAPIGLTSLDVAVQQECEKWPSLEMDESYSLTVRTGSAVLQANTVWGALRGLETFSQIVYHCPIAAMWLINNTQITDKPRFSWRGILLDTSHTICRRQP